MSRLISPSDLGLSLDPYGGPGDDPVPRDGGWLASVALVLRPGEGSPELLLIKRAMLEGDPWSGHMALPGGRKDPSDPSLLHTARRETREEVAIRLPGEEGVMGRLQVLAPVSRHLPRLTVLPLVFAVSREVEARVASHEVAEVHWIPLDHLRSAEARTTHRFVREGAAFRFPAFDVAGRTVWGLTHRILEDLLGRVE
jgi:8-oxo-dGTP pyrophosphatase MutT (NUDIX family)